MSIVSACDRYVASVGRDQEIQVYSHSGVRERTFYPHPLIRSHLKTVGNSISGVNSLRVLQVSWEKTSPGGVADKLAVVVESNTNSRADQFALVLVLEMSKSETQPIVLQQRATEGVEGVEWVQPLKDGAQQQESAYVNSKQLIVYTKYHVLARLYSLDCTHVLFEIAKPSKIIERPGTYGAGFMIISNEITPNAIMFLNEGSKSYVMNTFPLLTTGSMDWSKSGKWLLNFASDLFGYRLEIFNSLGFLVSPNLVGEPVMSCDGEGTKICYSYFAGWLYLEKVDYVIIVEVPPPGSKVRVRLFSMAHMQLWPQIELEDNNGFTWIRAQNGYVRDTVEYDKGAFQYAQLFLDSLVLVYENTVQIYRVFDGNIKLLHLVLAQAGKLKFTDSKLFIVCDTEVIMFHNNEFEVVYSNGAASPITDLFIHGGKVIVFESEGKWSVVDPAVVVAARANTSPNKEFDRGRRIKRNRLSILNDSQDEITDTFMQRAKRVKS